MNISIGQVTTSLKVKFIFEKNKDTDTKTHFQADLLQINMSEFPEKLFCKWNFTEWHQVEALMIKRVFTMKDFISERLVFHFHEAMKGRFGLVDFMQSTSAGSESCGCKRADWLSHWDCDPCLCTTERRKNSVTVTATVFNISSNCVHMSSDIHRERQAFEWFHFLITHHRLKVHLLIDQSFRDLCCLLEMNII